MTALVAVGSYVYQDMISSTASPTEQGVTLGASGALEVTGTAHDMCATHTVVEPGPDSSATLFRANLPICTGS